MGKLVGGVWKDEWYDTTSTGGAFVRPETSFRNRVTRDGSSGFPDWRLFTTLVRFDPVYYSHFKCNLRRLIDYRNLWSYTRDLYQVPGVADTVNLDHIKRHYFMSHPSINPTRIVPEGPAIDFSLPHDRDRFPAAT